MHVVLVAAPGPVLGERVVAQVVVAHPEDEEVAGLEFLRLLLALPVGFLLGPFRLLRLVWVMAGGLVEVAVPSVEVEAGELHDVGEGVGTAMGHQAGEIEVDRLEVGQAPLALERLEEEVDGDVFAAVVAVLLEEVPSARHGAQAARDTGLEEIEVAQLRAIVFALGA